jgi:hypothetical protein
LVGSKRAPEAPVIAADEAEHGAVLGGDLVEEVRRRQAAACRHVLRYQGRIAGQVLAHVLGDGAGP